MAGGHLLPLALATAVLLARAAPAAPGVVPGASLQAAITAAIGRGDTDLAIAPGHYVFGVGEYLLVEHERRGMRIHGGSVGTTLLSFYPGFGLALINCTNTTVSGLTIGSSQAPFAQGTVVSIHASTKEVLFRNQPGYAGPTPAESPWFGGDPEVKAMFWNATTRTVLHGQPLFTPMLNATRIGNDTYVLRLGKMDEYTPRPGDLLTLSARAWSTSLYQLPTYYKGVYSVFQSAGVTTEDVDIVGGTTMAILEWAGEGGHTYRRVRVRRPDGSDRLMSVCLDGFHSFSVRRGPLVENCTIEHIGDDFGNVHNRVWVVLARAGDTSILVIDPSDVLSFAPEQRPFDPTTLQGLGSGQFVRAGDSLAFYNSSSRALKGRTTATGKSERVDDPALHQRALAVLGDMGIKGVMPSSLLVYRIPVAAAASVDTQDFVQYDSASGEGAVFRHNLYIDSYDNSMRLQASHVTVAHNQFINSQSGINVQFDREFLEGSLDIHNVSIADNTFHDVRTCCNASQCFHIDPQMTDIAVADNHFSGDC